MGYEKTKDKDRIANSRQAIKKAGKLGLQGARTIAIKGGEKVKQVQAKKREESRNARIDEETVAYGAARLKKGEAHTQEGQDLAYRPREISGNFDLKGYIEHRKTAEPWTTVEIGPGDMPSGLNRKFTGESVYIGIEAGINVNFSTLSDKVFGSIKSKRPNENIFLLHDQAIGRSCSDNMSPESSRHYDMPDDSANEIFLVYTLDDPKTEVDLVLGEIYRMLKPGGSAIISDRSRGARGDQQLDGHLSSIEDAGLRSAYMTERGTDIAAQLGCYQTGINEGEDLRSVPPNLLLIATKPEA
jgi:hypothetical protein